MVRMMWILSRRKRRLFCVACAGRVIESVLDDRCIHILRVAESLADGDVPHADLRSAAELAWEVYHERWAVHASSSAEETDPVLLARRIVAECAADIETPAAVAGLAASLVGMGGGARQDEQAFHAELVREIMGNPFHSPDFQPGWRTSDTVGLARGIYEDRAFDRMPLLADALMDAGCDEEQILSHCRTGGPHVRDCWVVDLVLGKE
jgi:hypothetical protein